MATRTESQKASMSVLIHLMRSAGERDITPEQVLNAEDMNNSDFMLMISGTLEHLQEVIDETTQAMESTGWAQISPEGWEFQDTGVVFQTSLYENVDRPGLWQLEASFFFGETA